MSDLGQDQEVHTSENTESQTLNPESDREVEAKSDGWNDALEAFNDPTGEQEVPEAKQETKPEGEPKSHVEQGKPEALNLDDLKVPQKYKPAVQERIEKVTSELQNQVQARTQEVQAVREASLGVINTVKECIENPNKIPEFVVNYGRELGLDENVIRQYAGLYSNGEQPQAAPQEQQAPAQGMDGIFDKYVEKLVNTADPKEFVGSLKAMIAETNQATTQQLMGAVKNILMGYHQQIVNPNLQTIEEAKQQAVTQSQVSAWNSAFQSLKAKHPDVDKYAPEMKRLLREDAEYSELRSKLNKSPDQADRHERLLERLYRDLSYNDKIEAAKAPKPKFTGVAPSSKYISTTKTGGGDWDDPVHNEIWGMS